MSEQGARTMFRDMMIRIDDLSYEKAHLVRTVGMLQNELDRLRAFCEEERPDIGRKFKSASCAIVDDVILALRAEHRGAPETPAAEKAKADE